MVGRLAVALAGVVITLGCGRSKRQLEAEPTGDSAGQGGNTGGVGSGGRSPVESAGAGCVPVRALPVDSARGCELPPDAVEVVGCARGDSCATDRVCVIRKSDLAMFIGLGSSCFEELPQEWEKCVPFRDSFPECDGAGGAGG